MNYRENRSIEGRLLGKQELQRYTNMGNAGADKLAKAAGAVVRIGGRVLYDRVKIDAYIDDLQRQQA